MFFVTYAKKYAKQKFLSSKAVINVVTSIVESITCILLESITIGGATNVVKYLLSSNLIFDIIFDVTINVVYILFVMPIVRNNLHKMLKKPCQKVARKMLGLDIQSKLAFLKIKYTTLSLGMILTVIFLKCISNFEFFVHMIFFETLLIQLSVDIWNYHGHTIQNYVALKIEPNPSTKIFDHKQNELSKNKSNTISTPNTHDTILNTQIIEDCFVVK